MGKNSSKLASKKANKLLGGGRGAGAGGRLRRLSEPLAGGGGGGVSGGSGAARRTSGSGLHPSASASAAVWASSGQPLNSQQPPLQHQQLQPPPPQPPQQPPQSAIGRLRALFSFDAQVEGDLSFRKGDILELVDGSDPFWPLARNLRTKCTGYVPYNYVQVLDGSPSSLECWFELDRLEAERNLLLPGLPAGSYMLRPCHQAQGQANVTLSVRSEDNADSDADAAAARRVIVKHYMVREGSEGHYISPRIGFPTMADLIDHYRIHQDGLCCRLSEPCPRRWMPPPQLRDFEVNRQSLTLLQALGHGSFGEVWQARLNRLVEVAVKAMKPGCMNKEEFLAEAKLHYKLHHPRVVQLLGVCTVEEPFYIITEYMCNGALNNYLRQDKERRQIGFENMTDMMYQVADGMTYLAKNSVVHRDLRAANILVGEGNTVKVSDFGLSKCLSEVAEGSVEVHIKFPVRWTAPEAAKNKRFTTESDVWSFGVLLFEIVTRGELPYKNLTNKEIIPMVSDGYRLENPNQTDGVECDEYLYDVMLHCWTAQPEERPSFDQLSEIFKTYNPGAPGTAIRRPSEYSLSSLR